MGGLFCCVCILRLVLEKACGLALSLLSRGLNKIYASASTDGW